MQKMIKELEQAGRNPVKAVKASMQQTGKEAVGCFPIYAPEEVIYAAGYLPVGMWGGRKQGSKSDKYLQSFCCSVMKANLEQALCGDYDFLSAVIITAYCDTLKCMIENWKAALPEHKVIPIVYPQNRQSSAGKQFMADELYRIKAELEKLSGKSIAEEDLTKAVCLYDDYRETMQEFVKLAAEHTKTITSMSRHLIIKAAYFMDKAVYTEMVKELNAQLKSLPKESVSGKSVVLTGLMSEPAELLDIMGENGLHVIADDLAHESRQFRNLAAKSGSAIDRMVLRISNQDGCTFLYDEKKTRGELLAKMVRENHADGVIFCQMKFCDPDEFDYPILKKEMEEKEIPMLYLEIEQQMESLGQVRTRIQGYCEMLQQ